MVRPIRLALLLAALLLGPCTLAVNKKPFVVPELTSWKGGEGNFTLTSSTRILYAGSEAKAAAQSLAADYHTLTGQNLAIASGKKAGAGDIVLSLRRNKQTGAEGYTMSIGKRIDVTASTASGLYWATRTILQLSQLDGGRIPAGSTIDVPKYSVRGFMLDVGRKYIPMSYLKKLVRIMSYYKMNTLQVHLNDDGATNIDNPAHALGYAAFRLECATYPGLTAIDGSYTKAEFRDFVKEAAAEGVDIIPEIDSPAHSRCFIQYNPRLKSPTYDDTHLDLLNPESTTFMEGLWKEYLSGPDPVFAGKNVNIGTDEYSNKDTAVVEAFRRYTDHFLRYVEQFGKTASLWGSLTHAAGKTPVKAKGVRMNLWYNGYADPKEMIRQGYTCISIPDRYTYIVPMAGYYYDYLNCQFLYDQWTPNMVAQDTIDYDSPAIIGGMFAVWNDKNGNGISVKDIHHRLFPAMQTLAVKFWTAKGTTLPWKEFSALSARMIEAPGVNERALYGSPDSEVLTRAEVKSGDSMPIPEIGYNYTIEFTVNGRNEKAGTELFRSPSAVFYLADPATDMMGYERDGYSYRLPYRVTPGCKDRIRITGDNLSTQLYVNGRLVADRQPLDLTVGKYKNHFYFVSTLVFPLTKAGSFNSSITDFHVYNYIKK